MGEGSHRRPATGRLLLALAVGLVLTACSTTTAGTGSPAAPARPAAAGTGDGPTATLPVLQSRGAVASTPNGPVPIAVDLNEVRVIENVLQVTFTARNTLTADPAAVPWQIGGYFGDGAAARDAPDTVDGVYVLDPVGARRHLPGRNPDGQCLCSGALNGVLVHPGDSAVLVATFAAPGPDVDVVNVYVPQAGEFTAVEVAR
jgi:hypothetical protein